MTLTSEQIQQVIVGVIENTNQGRVADQQIGCAADSPIFGADSPLDSLGLVGLLFDIEDELRDKEIEVSLGDERAMSQTRSPFRTVATLAEYINTLINKD